LREVKDVGVLLDYAQGRLSEAVAEVGEFVRGPVKYLQEKQPIRKAVILEWTDTIRPLVGTKWEHKIVETKHKPLISRPKLKRIRGS